MEIPLLVYGLLKVKLTLFLAKVVLDVFRVIFIAMRAHKREQQNILMQVPIFNH